MEQKYIELRDMEHKPRYFNVCLIGVSEGKGKKKTERRK